ncbi:MAG: DUF2513 domain-containing protein [Mesosutterella sp.]|jgi:hypothetical protein|nr:DUF2513 domain-containing protein [Mesosutterella sp.]MCH3936686.1 DUF2513 domain-containing protein [Mesosutterella sp.]
MRRDWGIIRSLLSKIEAETLAEFVLGLHSDVMLGDGDKVFESTVARYLKLLSESGYVRGIEFARFTPGNVSYVRIEPEMTMAGYDLLEILRSDTVWGRVKEEVKTTGAAMTVEAIKIFASKAIKQLAG